MAEGGEGSEGGRCELLSGAFAVSLQAFIALVALGTLVFKRNIERPQRAWDVWALDVGKQFVGGVFVHFANIGLSVLLESDTTNSNQCVWYFWNYFLDCTVGVLIVYTIHAGICTICVRLWPRGSSFKRIGFYGNPPKLAVWWQQLKPWLVALVVNKFIVGAFLLGLQEQMIDLGNAIFAPFKMHPRVELVVVMLLCPWLLQTVQYWLFDCLLKARASDSPQFEVIYDED